MSDEIKVSDTLDYAMRIVKRCRSEGMRAAMDGIKYADCPYTQELEKSGWLDGWSKMSAVRTGMVSKPL